MAAHVNRMQRRARIIELWGQGLSVGQISIRMGP